MSEAGRRSSRARAAVNYADDDDEEDGGAVGTAPVVAAAVTPTAPVAAPPVVRLSSIKNNFFAPKRKPITAPTRAETNEAKKASPVKTVQPMPPHAAEPALSIDADDEPTIVSHSIVATAAAAVDLTNDATINSPPTAPMQSKPAKVIHPFFSKPVKKPTPAKEELILPPSAIPTEEHQPIQVDSTSPPVGACSTSIPVSPLPSTPQSRPRNEIDLLYSTDRLPKPEFFMTRKERVAVQSAKREKMFVDSIEAEAAERKRLIQSFSESGKKIHPFLQPKPMMAKLERSQTNPHSANGATVRHLSPYAAIVFRADEYSAPTFPTLFSHVPLDFDDVARGANSNSTVPVKLDFTAFNKAGGDIADTLESTGQTVTHPSPASNMHAPYTLNTVDQLSDMIRLVSGNSLPPALPLWARPTSYPPVQYSTAQAFRSSDVTNYLAQPKCQSFLKELVDRLAPYTLDGASNWSLDRIHKQVRRLLIRRVHCFRAAQRDEQLRARRSIDSSVATGGAIAPVTAASSRSDRAASRGNKHEQAEVALNQDEQVSHAFQPRPDSLWSEQYRAFRADEMFPGNERQRAQVKAWLDSWTNRDKASDTNQPTPASQPVNAPASKPKKKRRYEIWSDESDFDDEPYVAARSAAPIPAAPAELSNTLLLVGPPAGKTSLLYACCHESDTGVIEISNIDRRSQKDVLARCEEATQSHRLAMMTMPAGTNAAQISAMQSKISPIKSKPRIASPVKKAAPTSKEKSNEVKPKPLFGFFDSAAKKKAAIAAAALLKKAPKKKSHGDDDSDDDFLDSASPPPPAPVAPPAPPAPVTLSKREARKALFASKTRSVQVAVKGMPEEISDEDEEEQPSDSKSKKRKAPTAKPNDVDPAAFFANPSAFKKQKVEPSVPAVFDPLAPVVAVSSQTTILFEEIDHVFPSYDKKFLYAVRTLINHAKRPIILTCNTITEEIENIILAPQANGGNTMAVIERVDFEEIRMEDLLPSIYFICMVECGFHSVETQSSLPTLGELSALISFFHSDVRKILLSLQLRLNSLPLTQLLGTDIILAATNASAGATAANRKRMLGQLRHYTPPMSNHQDLILSNLGLLGRKDELMQLFQITPKNTHIAPTKGASKIQMPLITPQAAAAALYLAQTNTLYHARVHDLQLMQLNYLSTFMRLLLTQPSSLDSSIDVDISIDSEGWFTRLPVRLAALPKTAEQLYPIEEIQIPTETHKTHKDANSNNAVARPTTVEVTMANRDDMPVEPTTSTTPTTADVASADSVPMDESDNAPAGEVSPLIVVSDDSPSPSPSPSATRTSRSRRSKRIMPADDEDDPAVIDDVEIGQVDLVDDDADDDMKVAEVSEPDMSVEVIGVKRLTKSERAAQKLAERRAAQMKQARQQQQRWDMREKLIEEEEKRRQIKLRHAGASTRPRIDDRLLCMLDSMASMADDLSAIDILTPPRDDSTIRPYGLLSRSHSRFHPSIHGEVTSMSRDYYPLYFETTITSSNWTSLEQQQQDAIETEVEPIDREARHQADIAKSFALSAVSDSRKQLLAPGEEYEFEDIVRPAIEFARDMAAVADVAAMRVIKQAANKLHRVDDNTNATMPTIATIATPTESLPFKVEPTPTPTPTTDPNDTQLVNAVDPAQPPATCTPFFLATADPVSIATLDCMRVYQSPAKTTPEYRTQMSQLVWELWDKLDQSHPFQSTAFLCDVFPHVRGLIFDALDYSPLSGSAAPSVASDALFAASLAAGDVGRASRRTTRAAKTTTKLPRRWSHLSHILSKSSELLTRLDQSPWKDRTHRPLQSEAIWTTTITT